MNQSISARLAAGLLSLHGVMELAGLLAINTTAQALESFGGMGKPQIALNAFSIVLLGVLWGIARLVAAWGIWSFKKWAIGFGMLLSVASLVAALTIIPAGIVDTLLGILALGLLLYAWFGVERVMRERENGE